MGKGSSLTYYTREQTHLLGERLPGVRVEVVMRHGQPLVGPVLGRLRTDGVRRVAILFVYPQYAASIMTTISDTIASRIGHNRDGSELCLHHSFPAAPVYIEAFVTALKRY